MAEKAEEGDVGFGEEGAVGAGVAEGVFEVVEAKGVKGERFAREVEGREGKKEGNGG